MYIRLVYSKESETISFAASELKYYLSKITNSIVFVDDSTIQHSTIALELFSDSQKHSDTDDEYHIEVSKGNGHIYGSNSRSVLLGIYKYLTLLGCRFLRPGKAYEYLPMLSSTEDLDICCHEKAENKYRGVCIEGADCPENIFEFIDWLPKLGFNTFFLQFELPYAFLNLWYSHKNNPMLSAEEFSLEKAAEISLLIDKELQKRSLKHHRVGHGWTCSVLNQNTLGWVEADNTLDKSQLPLTALVNGERGFFGGIILCADFLYDAFLNKVSGNGRYCCRSNLCLLGNRGACNRCIAENVFQYGTSVFLISHKRLTSYYRETGIIGRNLYNTINVKRLLEVKLV